MFRDLAAVSRRQLPGIFALMSGYDAELPLGDGPADILSWLFLGAPLATGLYYMFASGSNS